MSMDENLKKEIQASSPEKLAKISEADKKKLAIAKEAEKWKREEELAKIKAAMVAKGIKEDD